MSWAKYFTFVILLSFGLVGLVQTTAYGARAQVLHFEPAYYPGIARLAGIEGTVKVLVRVSALGSVKSVEILSATHLLFEKPAKLAAWLSTYSPSIQNGVAVPDSLIMEYQFPNEYASGSSSGTGGAVNREQVLDLFPNQVCLYGNWLSGQVMIRLCEDRVYVDGIRVFPTICGFNRDLNKDFAIVEVVQEQLIFECRLFERELAIMGISLSRIRIRTLEMLRKIPIVAKASLTTSSSIQVEISDGFELLLVLPDPQETEEYYRLQPQMASAEGSYYFWLSTLHPRVGGTMVLFTAGTSMTMSLDHNTAVEILEYVASSALNEHGGLEWPSGLGGIGRSLEAVIRSPLSVERL